MSAGAGDSRSRPARVHLASLAVIGIVIGILATGCASGTGSLRPGTPDRGDAEVERLKDRVLELQRRLSVTEVELERLRREVVRLGGRPAGQSRGGPDGSLGSTRPARSDTGSADRPDRADEGVEIEDIGAVDRPAPPPGPPEAVEESVEPPAERARVRVEPPTPATDPSDERRAGEAELTAEAQRLYDRGYALYHQGRFVDAESTFQQFLQAHADTELGDNAQYWIGEARLARGDLEGGLAAFRETARRFPDGNKVPVALLKAGETREALGDRGGAVEIYREVLRSFPGTTAAAVARDRLADLDAGSRDGR